MKEPKRKTAASRKAPAKAAPAAKKASAPARGGRRAAQPQPETADTARKRPGGRSERNRKFVTAAVLTLLREGNLDFELQEVAALSGVHRTTIFRRWPDRAALMAEAMREHASRFSVDLSGNWQIDLRRIAFALRDFFADPVELAMNRMHVITTNESYRTELTKSWDSIIESLQETLTSAQKDGLIPAKADTNMVITILLTTLVAYQLMGPTPDDAFVERLVNQLIRSCV